MELSLVLLSADLIAVSRVEGAAARRGLAARTASNVDSVVGQCRASEISLVIVDLNSRGVDIAELMEQLSTLGENRPRVVAFGPHVHQSLLAAAEAAGCDAVLSKGQFFSRVDEFVSSGGP